MRNLFRYQSEHSCGPVLVVVENDDGALELQLYSNVGKVQMELPRADGRTLAKALAVWTVTKEAMS